jgi:integrase
MITTARASDEAVPVRPIAVIAPPPIPAAPISRLARNTSTSIAPGRVYRRHVRVCTVCDQRLDTTTARRACETAGHRIDMRALRIWWITYSDGGTRRSESSRSEDRAVAEALVQAREGRAVVPVPVPAAAPAGLCPFADAADDLVADYRMNANRSLRTVLIRINKHLRPVFGADDLSAITTTRVRLYVTQRQAEGASNATINRDLITLKRMCTLAVQGGRLPAKPYIPLLKEQNIRQGFFEPDQCEQIKRHLPDYLRGIAAFAFVTGWRTPSEILPLEWRQVDWAAGEVRLDAGTTKNGDGRVFPLTAALRTILDAQQTLADALTAQGLTPRYVFCYTAGKKAGERIQEAAFIHRWWTARIAAGCPTRIPHDFRRTAVRNLVRAGVPERVAMQLTGHKTRAIFERYNIVSPEDLRDAASRLDRFTAAMT